MRKTQTVCPVHLDDGRLCRNQMPCALHPGPARRSTRQPARPAPHRESPPAPVDHRDLHALGWWLIEQVLDDESGVAREQVAIAATLMRVLAALGPASADSATAARETELRALLLHGRRLRDEDDWRLAHSLFDDAALELLSALATRSGEGDGGDRGQPLRRVEARADEVDLPRVAEDEE